MLGATIPKCIAHLTASARSVPAPLWRACRRTLVVDLDPLIRRDLKSGRALTLHFESNKDQTKIEHVV